MFKQILNRKMSSREKIKFAFIQIHLDFLILSPTSNNVIINNIFKQFSQLKNYAFLPLPITMVEGLGQSASCPQCPHILPTISILVNLLANCKG